MIKKTTMDFTNLLNELKGASLFELYRLNAAIYNELENPKRIMAVKQKLNVGMQVSYFEGVQNKSIPATLLKVNPKNAVILCHETKKRYAVSYHMLNIDDVDTNIYEDSNKEDLTANNLKVGDSVGFKSKGGENVVGLIKKLNQKTVSLVTKSGMNWRVAYCFLHRVYDAELVMDEPVLTIIGDGDHK